MRGSRRGTRQRKAINARTRPSEALTTAELRLPNSIAFLVVYGDVASPTGSRHVQRVQKRAKK